MLGDTIVTFNPFESRICRDARNIAGHAFVAAIEKNDLQVFDAAVSSFRSRFSEHCSIRPFVTDYLNGRRDLLCIVLEAIKPFTDHPDYFFAVAAILWNRQLFFEFHEWLEIRWQNAESSQKKMFQALVVAAIAYEHLSYGRLPAAKKNRRQSP